MRKPPVGAPVFQLCPEPAARPERRQRLTNDLARRVPFTPKGKARTYTDAVLAGFYLRVTCGAKTWICQRSVGGRQQRYVLGRYPELSAEEARQKARGALHAIGEGRNLAEERRAALAEGITLTEALEMHLRAKDRAERTEADYRDRATRYLGDWMGRSMKAIGEDRRGVRERHERVSKEHGPTAADYAMRILRACYNRALREYPDLPPNPVRNVDFNGSKRRVVDLSPKRLRDWGRTVLTLSPVRRDLHLFMILTGMRRTATLEARAADVDFAAGKLHVPNPKGGADRAFDVPLSGPIADLLRHRIAENEAISRGTPWLFPSVTSQTGHASEVKESALDGLCGHALRHAFKTFCEGARVPWAHSKLLLNHTVPDVTFGYLQRELDELRKSQSDASAYILAKLGLTWTPGEWPPTCAAEREGEE